VRLRPNCCLASGTANEVLKQRRREFESANEIARAIDETVQVIRTRTAFSLRLRNHYLARPRGPSSLQTWRLSGSDAVEIQRVGSGGEQSLVS
jgi:hypothetical protein